MLSVNLASFPKEVQKLILELYKQKYCNEEIRLEDEQLHLNDGIHQLISREVSALQAIWSKNKDLYFKEKCIDCDPEKLDNLVGKYGLERIKNSVNQLMLRYKNIGNQISTLNVLDEFNRGLSNILLEIFQVDKTMQPIDILDEYSSEKLRLDSNQGALLSGKINKTFYNYALCHHCYSKVKSHTIQMVTGNCYRNEKDYDRFRLPKFKMTELVFFDSDNQLAVLKEKIMALFKIMGDSIGLKYRIRIANDSFITNDVERILYQVLNKSKIELEVYTPIEDKYISICSSNYHGSYFSQKFSITREDKSYIQSMCVGFGLNRIIEILKDAGEL
ncbi:aminoacyl--tRNA ligase-related protein [Thermoactinomyces sp. DSM 45892]|uniref:tRNA ligase subunit PheS family protein n=1 Tax=Thermoactinomyces sp. DSM 45892 TaxID=1882753 RepID=UPI0015A421A7|nr:aminoacyl--tRNA ligase-related protein [Thermoactinomyces sp. DSM 45892]